MLMIKGGEVDEYLKTVELRSQARILEGKKMSLDWEKHAELIEEHAMLSQRVSKIGRNLMEATDSQRQAEEWADAATQKERVAG